MATEVEARPAVTMMTPVSPVEPLRTYAERLADRKESSRRLDRELDRLGLARLFTFGAALLLAWLSWGQRLLSPWWLALPVALFFLLLFRYDFLHRQWRRAVRAIRYYERGLERLADRWQGKGHGGERFLKTKSLFASDLDLFGTGSLFERLCITRTRPGEESLAHWLTQPANPDDIRARQAAVTELRPRLDLREDLALLGAEVPPVDFADLGDWGAAPPILSSWTVRVFVGVLGICNLAAAVAWLGTILGLLQVAWSSLALAISLLISGVVIWRHWRRVHQVLETVEPMGHELFLLSKILARIEREEFTTPLLREVHTALLVKGTLPSWQIGKLAGLVDWLNSIRNQFFLPLALLLLWRTQMAFAVEFWRRRSGPAIRHWLEALGTIEALSSLAGYAYENPGHVFPEIAAGGSCFQGQDLGHPLLPRDQCVCNDLDLSSAVRILIISGSNMSGKSTMLRTVGTNAALALAGSPVRARSLRLSPLALVATLRIQDSLLAGESRFKAEINRIRELLEHARQEPPVLFLLDELFHGTNSHDRCIGAEALLRQLLDGSAIGLLTTHDLTLTQIAERLGTAVGNVHFADQFVGNEMHFDYKMRPGVVPHSNALALMRAVGLEV